MWMGQRRSLGVGRRMRRTAMQIGQVDGRSVLRVALEVGAGERAVGNDAQAARNGIIEDDARQARSNAPALETRARRRYG